MSNGKHFMYRIFESSFAIAFYMKSRTINVVSVSTKWIGISCYVLWRCNRGEFYQNSRLWFQQRDAMFRCLWPGHSWFLYRKSSRRTSKGFFLPQVWNKEVKQSRRHICYSIKILSVRNTNIEKLKSTLGHRSRAWRCPYVVFHWMVLWRRNTLFCWRLNNGWLTSFL